MKTLVPLEGVRPRTPPAPGPAPGPLPAPAPLALFLGRADREKAEDWAKVEGGLLAELCLLSGRRQEETRLVMNRETIRLALVSESGLSPGARPCHLS